MINPKNLYAFSGFKTDLHVLSYTSGTQLFSRFFDFKLTWKLMFLYFIYYF